MDYQSLIADFTEQARAQYPREACALVYVFKGRAMLHPCQNIATDPENEFLIGPAEYAEADRLGDVVAVLHSHPNGTGHPSEMDRAAHSVSEIDWYIIGLSSPTADPDIHHMPAAGPLPLLGRVFTHGVVDCYTLIRDWYAQERQIALPDYIRDDDWWHKGGDLYSQNFASAGFVERPAGELPQTGDVLLMNVAAPVLNHGAIYERDGVILHHLHGRLSCRELYSGYYRDRTRKTLYYSPDQADRCAGP